MSFYFPPECRIKHSKEFELAFRSKRVVNKWFSINVVENHYNFARLGMIISKRSISKSVHRNYAKRLIREVFRCNNSVLPSFDYVVRIRRNLNKETSGEARDALLQLMLNSSKS